MTVIKYINTKDLKANEKEILKSIIEPGLYKIERSVPDALELIIDVKTLKPQDEKTRRHILNLKLITAKNGTFRTKLGESEYKRSGSYDLTLGCHKVMTALESEVNHKMKSTTSTWKRLAQRFKFRVR